jgi:hypothetical protein
VYYAINSQTVPEPPPDVSIDTDPADESLYLEALSLERASLAVLESASSEIVIPIPVRGWIDERRAKSIFRGNDGRGRGGCDDPRCVLPDGV